MSRQITVKHYGRHFRKPLRTARGEWVVREGLIVRVEASGRIGYGEVAPLPEFGTESVSAAGAFLEQLVREPDLDIPGDLPCCRFGLSAASGRLGTAVPTKNYAVSALLPAGAAGRQVAAEKIAAGYTSLKWKIGVEPIAKEQIEAERLLESLPEGVTLRLDANASLSVEALDSWLDLLANYREQIEYLEQPLAVGQEASMATRMAETGIPIALDESLNGASPSQWLAPGAWEGPLVIKALLMGDISSLAEKLQPLAEQIVLSSVFETGVGLENALALADAMPELARPMGFDTLDAFDDALMPFESSPNICATDRLRYDPEQIWSLI